MKIENRNIRNRIYRYSITITGIWNNRKSRLGILTIMLPIIVLIRPLPAKKG